MAIPVLGDGDSIRPVHLPYETGEDPPSPAVGAEMALSEKVHIRRVIAASETREEAAGMLGIGPATRWRRRKP